MKIKDAIEILRPINGLMGSLTVVIGILNTRVGVPVNQVLLTLLFGILTYFFLSGAGMIINDIYDIEIDKINRPERPIPSGRISLEQAKILFFLTYAIGIAFSVIHVLLFNLSVLIIILAVFFGFMGWIYAKWGKKSGFPGNLIVGVSFSIGLIYGALLNSSTIPLYIHLFFYTSFFLLVSREIIKGCEDIEGDKTEGVKTLALIIEPNKAKIISAIFAALAIFCFIGVIFTPIINPSLFFIFMILGVGIVSFAIVYMLKPVLKQKDYGLISLSLKVGAFGGLLAFLFASL